mmetsp:Transcript_14511/g.57030  ORF Transcript_14511/g.57030 Transcript_14511/m.57030 type:complete len:262 (-) Transcript_14511:44-829(-)
MAHAILVQGADSGKNAAVQVKGGMSIRDAYVVGCEARAAIEAIRARDLRSTFGPHSATPNFVEGSVELEQYAAYYELTADIYIVLIAPKAMNPFASRSMVQATKAALSTVCKGELGEAKILKVGAEVRSALLRVLMQRAPAASAAPAGANARPKPEGILAEHPGWMVQQQTLLENMKLMEMLTSFSMTLPAGVFSVPPMSAPEHHSPTVTKHLLGLTKEDLEPRLLSVSAPEVMKQTAGGKRSSSMLTHDNTPERGLKVPL